MPIARDVRVFFFRKRENSYRRVYRVKKKHLVFTLSYVCRRTVAGGLSVELHFSTTAVAFRLSARRKDTAFLCTFCSQICNLERSIFVPWWPPHQRHRSSHRGFSRGSSLQSERKHRCGRARWFDRAQQTRRIRADLKPWDHLITTTVIWP